VVEKKKTVGSGDLRPDSLDFIRAKVAEDLETGRYAGRVVTRFPPEPNGYPHIGHAKSCCLNFGIALENEGGVCHLRFDDTNPETEDIKYVEAIKQDVRWLGFDWREHLYHASDYFEQLYDFAVILIRRGRAYVDSLSEEEIREYRGTVTQPGRESPYRGRSVEENLKLFERMRAGAFKDGEHVLRGKIDMAHPNMLMRDPLLYRIRHASHYRRGDAWCIYPLYDFTHCLSDAIENITHSLCTLEFENNRALYDWVLDNVGIEPPRPEQTEFARLDLDYTVLSKRKLIRLVEDGHVSGWDDPRMPTIAGLRRRGVTPEAIRDFCDMIGVDKVNSRVDIAKLEYAIRNDLNQRAQRVLCVLRPLKVTITNFPEAEVELLDASYWPRDVPKQGSRELPFSRDLYIERQDFMEDPPKKYFRLAPGREVRLRHAYIIKCEEAVKDPESGEVTELRCTYDPETLSGPPADGRKVKGTIHWVSAAHALPCQVRLYDRLFRTPDPEDAAEGRDFIANLNPDSLVVLHDSLVEPSVADDPPATRYQFERQGYFISDALDSKAGALVFNRTVTLRDSWAKIAARGSA
jgi:glutaminyl-tRNA synthetase